MSGHLTPSVLEKEIAKMANPLPEIHMMHLKLQDCSEIDLEIQSLGRANIDFLKEGGVFQV